MKKVGGDMGVALRITKTPPHPFEKTLISNKKALDFF